MLTRCLSLFPWITKSAIAWEVGVQVEPTTQTSNIWVIRVFSLPCLACWSHSPRSWAWTEGSCRLTMLDWGSRSESRLSSVDTNLWPDRTHCGSKQSSPRKHGYFYLTQATDTETTIPVLFRGGYFFFFFADFVSKNEPVMPREWHHLFFWPTTNLELLKQNGRISQNSSPSLHEVTSFHTQRPC